MRAVIQRVKKASLFIDNQLHRQIDQGFMILIAVHVDDSEKDVEYMAKKIVNMRIFSDENDKLNHSIIEIDGEILLVSQFTLYADTKKGNRPSFTQSANYKKGLSYYNLLINKLEEYNVGIKTGVFGADMQIELINDGPVTIILDSE